MNVIDVVSRPAGEVDTAEFVTGFLLAAGWDAMVRDEDRDAWDGHLEDLGVDRRDGRATGAEVLALVSDSELRDLVSDAMDFIDFHRVDLVEAVQLGSNEADLGINWYLSRNHHGTGLWDAGLGEVGDRLHAAADPYGAVSVEVWFDETDGWSACVL